MTPGLLLLVAQLEDVPAPGPDPARLEKAAALLGPARREGALGPWRLFTDLPDGPALRELARVAARLPESYRARFGLDVEARPREAVVLFAREEAYQAFAGDGKELGTPETPGHAGGGLAAAASGAAAEQTRPVVVHELSHLLTQDAFARPAPPWIEEGLSEDLGWCRVDPEGRLLFGTLEVASSTRWVGDSVRRTTGGPRATVDGFAIHARAGRVPPLSALLAPGTKLFSEPDTRRDAYTEAGLLVRFLLGRDAGRAERFRVFLRAAALGAPAGLDDLAAALGTSSKELERDFARFLRGL